MKKAKSIFHAIFLLLLTSISLLSSIKLNAASYNSSLYIDTLPWSITEPWKFIDADDSAMCNPSYNDSNWMDLPTLLIQQKGLVSPFHGKCWFRLWVTIDAKLINQPLAFGLSHVGASEIYLDGILLKKYGEIKDEAGSQYFDPHEEPFIVNIKDTGKHLLAVRYANFKYDYNYRKYRKNNAGFELNIGEASERINNALMRNNIVSVVTISLIGIFFVLSMIHLLLFLFYPPAKSNLYFSIFMFCLSATCVIGYINFFSSDPYWEMQTYYHTNAFFCLIFLSLSFLINEHFTSKWGWRFKVILSIGIIAIVSRYLNFHSSALITLLLILIVSLETVVIVIRAMVQKIKGAKIIGIGFLFLCALILSLFLTALLHGGDFDINDSTPTGQIILLLGALSVLSIPVSMSVYLAWDFAQINKSLLVQLDQVKDLSEKNIEHEKEKVRLITGQNEMLEKKVDERTSELKKEKQKSDELLLNILPAEVADELKSKGYADAKQYGEVTVLFTDFVNFTGISSQLSPTALLKELNICFKAFDEITSRNGLEKIKTIGDAYLAVCGLPHGNTNHAIQTVKAAKEILEFIASRKQNGGVFDIRIGLNSGPVVAGIVGIKKFAYDIWGDTVNLANRMESSGEAGKINISATTYELVKDVYQCTYRGKIDAKGKGLMDMYFVV